MEIYFFEICFYYYCRVEGDDQEKNIYEAYLIVLDSVERCLANVNKENKCKFKYACFLDKRFEYESIE
jgi:hypothetical protein